MKFSAERHETKTHAGNARTLEGGTIPPLEKELEAQEKEKKKDTNVNQSPRSRSSLGSFR
jgi:hypothetical protein